MSREAQQESLSAVMDNEADELELRRVLAAAGDDAELRGTWARYQMARAVMHKELLEPRLDIAAAVSAALADEPTPGKVVGAPWRTLGRVAVAASVTLAVLVGVRFYNNQDDSGLAPQLAQQPAAVQQPQQALPPVAVPAAAYVPFVQTGHLIFLSGHIARRDGKPWVGQLGADMTTEQGKAAARGSGRPRPRAACPAGRSPRRAPPPGPAPCP